MLEKVEKQLIKRHQKDKLDEQFNDYLARYVLVKVTDKEIQERKNKEKPLHYLSMH